MNSAHVSISKKTKQSSVKNTFSERFDFDSFDSVFVFVFVEVFAF